MLSLISASNELPTGEEELNALYDRFLVRSFVDYVREDNLHKLFETTTNAPAFQKLTQHNLLQIQQAAENVTLPTEIIDAIRSIWKQHKTTFKEDRRENLSDRRLKKIIQLLRVSAATNERQIVDLSDVMLLKNCLWNHYDNAEKVREIIIKTLQKHSYAVPINGTHAEITKESTAKKSAPRSEGKIKGFSGSGTQDDPILIQSLQDFMDISRPDVGTKGYYFKQTADIDCASLTHWSPMIFQGHYDGDGNSIKNLLKNTNGGWNNLFSTIQAKSSIINLTLEQCVLANDVQDSEIIHCQTDGSLIGKAANCRISECEAGRYLVLDTATNCRIRVCQVGGYLVLDTATNCQISECQAGVQIVEKAKNCQIVDCITTMSKDIKISGYGGIANELRNKSIVERCFVTGDNKIKADSSVNHAGGIVNECDGGIIRNCAVGELEVEIKGYRAFRRIYYRNNYNSPTLENNAAIDSIIVNGDKYQGEDNPNGQDGKTVAAAMFNQRYFEFTLGWDFEKVWEWDDVNNRPALRKLSALNVHQHSTPNNNVADMEDLLFQQIRANIWL